METNIRSDSDAKVGAGKEKEETHRPHATVTVGKETEKPPTTHRSHKVGAGEETHRSYATVITGNETKELPTTHRSYATVTVGKETEKPPTTHRSHKVGAGEETHRSYATVITGNETKELPTTHRSYATAIAGKETKELPTTHRSCKVGAGKEREELPVVTETPMERPNLGTTGKPIEIYANHFSIEWRKKNLYHYVVTTQLRSSTSIDKKIAVERNRELIENAFATIDGYSVDETVYDGKNNLYTTLELPFKFREFLVRLKDFGVERLERLFRVTITLRESYLDIQQTQRIPSTLIHALSLVLTDEPSRGCFTLRTSLFPKPPDGFFSKIGGIEIRKGFFHSLRPTQMGLSLNIGESLPIAHALSQYFEEKLNLNLPLSASDAKKVDNVLKGIKVKLIHLSYTRTAKISGISMLPVAQLGLTSEGNTHKNVVQYFRERYKHTVAFPNLPAIRTGTEGKPIYFPMEVCCIIQGQPYVKSLRDEQLTDLRKVTGLQTPQMRKNTINEGIKKCKFIGRLASEGFGMSAADGVVSIGARVFTIPHVLPVDSMITFEGATIKRWTSVSFSKKFPLQKLKNFCGEVIKTCTRKGIKFSDVPIIPVSCRGNGDIEKVLHEVHRTAADLQLLIVILPDETGSYGNIKTICETELGIISQCCNPDKALNPKNWYLESIALKINTKAGGRNTVLADAIGKHIPIITERPTIIFGADVNHPAIGDASSPSIAAVVASMDWPGMSKYRGLISAQGHRKEIIEDLYKLETDSQGHTIDAGLIRDHLRAFYRANGNQKPQSIIFFRDGVGEGAFKEVLLNEVTAIRKACHSLEQGYSPLLTFVVVQKRHHTRFFPNERGPSEKGGNVPQGTVVDTDICHMTNFDFYLKSHANSKGTSRPAHYQVLVDDHGFSADLMQMFINAICYTNFRDRFPLTVVPPVQYAHLAAFRGNYYLQNKAAAAQFPQVKDNVKEVMFYC